MVKLHPFMYSQDVWHFQRSDMLEDIMQRDITWLAVCAPMLSFSITEWDFGHLRSLFASNISRNMDGYPFKYSEVSEAIVMMVCPIVEDAHLLIKDRLQTYLDACRQSHITLSESAFQIDVNTYTG